MHPLIQAKDKRDAYETKLEASLLKELLQLQEGRPWAAVALAYHHELSFGPVVGILPLKDWESGGGIDAFNPAHWEMYDDPVTLDDEVESLAEGLEDLLESAPDDGVPYYGRQIHVRVATKLRAALIEEGCLVEHGLVFATQYDQVDWEDNVLASNPPDAVSWAV